MKKLLLTIAASLSLLSQVIVIPPGGNTGGGGGGLTPGQAQNASYSRVTVSGDPAYAGNLSPSINAYTGGACYSMSFAQTNSTAYPTVNINGVGDRYLYPSTDSILGLNAIVVGVWYRTCFVDDGGDGYFSIDLIQSQTVTSVYDLSTYIDGSTFGLSEGHVRDGTTIYDYSDSYCEVGGSTATGSVFVYVTDDGVIHAGHNSAFTLTCDGITESTGVSSFPAGSIPISIVSVVSNTTDSFQDKRAFWAFSTGGSGGGATDLSGLTDLQVTRTSSTVLAIGAGNARFGNVTSSFSAATGTISGTVNSGTAYVYVSSAAVLTIGHNTTTTITCSGCTTATSISAFPAGSIPLATWTFTSNAWNTSGGVDQRAMFSNKLVAAGTGLTSSDSGGTTTIAVDTSSVDAKFIQGRAVSSAAPSDTNVLVWSASNNRWEPGAGGGGSVTVITGTASWNPGTFSAGDTNVTAVTVTGLTNDAAWVCSGSRPDLDGSWWVSAFPVGTDSAAFVLHRWTGSGSLSSQTTRVTCFKP